MLLCRSQSPSFACSTAQTVISHRRNRPRPASSRSASCRPSGAGAVNSSLLVQHDNLHPDQDRAIEDTLEKLRNQPAPVMAIVPGAETGVELAEKLAARFGTRNNGEEMTQVGRKGILWGGLGRVVTSRILCLCHIHLYRPLLSTKIRILVAIAHSSPLTPHPSPFTTPLFPRPAATSTSCKKRSARRACAP